MRRRFAVSTACLLALVVGIGLVAAWFVVGAELRREVDSSLRSRAAAFQRVPRRIPTRPPRTAPPPEFGSAQTYVQFVSSSGKVGPGSERVRLPTRGAVAVAAGRRGAFFSNATVAGIHLRIYVARIRRGTAVEIARPLTENDSLLARLRILFLAVSVLTLAAGVAVALVFTRRVLQPIRTLTQHAERLAETGDLTQRADASRSDELGRLAAAFNKMLEALASSVRQQRQLVADASHELRTPLAVARTNLDVLRRHEALSPEARREIIGEAMIELKEMTQLIDELVALARGDIATFETEPTRLDVLVEAAAEVAARRSGRELRVTTTPSVVDASPSALGRAVSNLLDNALKWGPGDTPVDVTVEGGVVSVRDYGPGIDPADMPYVFDRFYRAAEARTMPGSGLGLAIVRQVAEAHGGVVSVEAAPGGGALFTLLIPPVP
jgi:two-component system, OmpR family, sensor histidine kinase MprB